MWIARDTILRENGIILCANNDGSDFLYWCRVTRSDVAMTSFKMTSLHFKKIKYQISNQHKFCFIVHKNNVFPIKIVEIMALFSVFLDHPSYTVCINLEFQKSQLLKFLYIRGFTLDNYCVRPHPYLF